ncbi:hypothetical protein BU23DRAFT_100983 [Bimuria novae-zelandiae CBS 107.79]|uniref:Fungal N-terminal domain-containing protein n=1 Tax=Bimuria novae-zelandiae CBS 107.79 TaxID=1447943 RepID=A0A6A5VV21_9PLEO|nr:hypothetical protein BU23DRAFT_100983 [Bimuria novae-zelandiae CBS 107.79]
MAEVLIFLSAVQASTQLAEQAFGIFSHIRRAYLRQKDLLAVIERHENELNSVESVLGVLKNEKDFHTTRIAKEVRRLKEVQDRLNKLLIQLDPKPRGKISQFTRQLVHGDANEKKLDRIMVELGQVKTSVLLCMQVTTVGVMRNVEKQLVADAVKIERIDANLREALENYEGLRIAQLLKGRSPSDDGYVPLSEADLRSLDNENHDEDNISETLVDDDSITNLSTLSTKTERVIKGNSARHQALQINASLGEDVWKEIDRLEIKDNIAEDHSIQVNHGMTLEVLSLLVGIQAKKMAYKCHDNARDSS